MIKLEQTVKRFGEFAALNGADMEIPAGTAFGLLGSNGAGKSTILRLISGVYKPDSGRVTIDGRDVYDAPAVMEKVFFINDETVQFGSMTLGDLKRFYSGFYPKFDKELFDRLCRAVNLPEKRRLDTFSKGMKRQEVVITGLSSGTEILLLDEAFDGLDPTMRIIVKRMLVDAMLDRQLTVIISSHNLAEINEMCDTVTMLHQGKILFTRDIDSVKGDVHKVQCAFASAPDDSQIAALSPLHHEVSGSVHYIIIKGSEEDIRKVMEPLSPVFCDVIPLTLEEVFIYEMEGLGYAADMLRAVSGKEAETNVSK